MDIRGIQDLYHNDYIEAILADADIPTMNDQISVKISTRG